MQNTDKTTSAQAQPTFNLYRVSEGAEYHIVIADSPAQARGIAFGHRFTDDEPDREWPVFRADHLALAASFVDENDGSRRPVSWELSAARAKHLPRYVAGSCW